MSAIHTTAAGDRLDRLAYKRYGHLSGTVEAVLAANPGLAEQPSLLPEGVAVVLPDLPGVKRLPRTVKLWGY